MKYILSAIFVVIAMLFQKANAESWRALFGQMDYNVHRDFRTLDFFPHQVAVSDLICTGTVISTNDGRSAIFSVDDILWGYVTSSNITIRHIEPWKKTIFVEHAKYLVFAFTNDWWDARSEADIYHELGVYKRTTDLPSGLKVFPEFRFMDSCHGLIQFNAFAEGGTNFWPATRTFMTNFLDAARIHYDDTMAAACINRHLNQKEIRDSLPKCAREDLLRYNFFHFAH